MLLDGIARGWTVFGVTAVLVLTGAWGCSRGPKPPVANSHGGATMKVQEDRITFNGQTLTLGTRLSDWTKVLGPPSRVVDRAGGFYVWDAKGLAVSLQFLHPENDPHVASLWIFFRRREADFWARTMFRGAVTFVQDAESPGEPPTIGTLDESTTAAALDRQGISRRFGFPSLSGFTSLRWATDPDHEGKLEVCVVSLL
ncbi:MAG: hypothetical protein ACKVPX_12775 [Myxococcaceae bacterium]